MAPNEQLDGSRVAWIGLGNLGSIIATKIVEKGPYSAICVYNRTQTVSEKFASNFPNVKHLKVASSLEECVREADILFTNVANDDAITNVIETALKAVSPGEKKLFVDLSTVHPKTTDRLADIIGEAGQEFVACPVFGTPDVAEQGNLVVALAGSKANIDKVRPFCKGVIAREEINYSDQPHSHATVLKIIGNTLVLHLVEGLAEGHVLAEKSGLGSANLHALIEIMYPGPNTAYSNRLMNGDYYKSTKWGSELALKDYGHAKSLAKEYDVQMRGLDLAAEHLRDVSNYANEKQGRNGDIAGIYGAVREEAGLNFENRE